MESIFLFGFFVVLLTLSVPIGYAIGIATSLTLVLFSDISPVMVSQSAIMGIDSFPLMALPFFLLAGNIMSAGGIARRLLDFANILFSAFTGGLAIVTTVSCMFFAAVSGSAIATTAAIGSFMIPAMKEKGYNESFAASLTAASGTIGVIIPPSIPFVIYGVVVGTSIGDLFIAGIIPGILMGCALIFTSYLLAKKYGYKRTGHFPSVREVWVSFKRAIWALLAPVIVLGGIYAGIFTPTEAAVTAVFYSLFVGTFIYKELDLKSLYKNLFDAMFINGITTFMIGFSLAFASYLSIKQIPVTITTFIVSITTNKYILFFLLNVFLLAIGTLIDGIPATIILSPILLPIVTKLGMTPITFGVVLTLNLAIGFITPPYGINLFVASSIGKVSIESMMKYMGYFFTALMFVLFITTYVPATTMFLVNLLK